MTTWLLASLHLIGFGMGLGAVWARGRALRGVPHIDDLRRAFLADNLWAVAGILLIGSGLLRLFFVPARESGAYFNNHIFIAKMSILGAIILLEILPMLTLIRWRFAVGSGEPIRFGLTAAIVRISYAQAFLMILMVLAATAVARGYGF